jgi:hypothetical protein
MTEQFTVIGYWDQDYRQVIGVVEGKQEVMGGMDPGDSGLFAELVEAKDWVAAEDMVHGTTGEVQFDA